MLSPSPYALPVAQLLLAVRADPRWRDRAAAVEEAWLFERPRSPLPPCPLAFGDRGDPARSVGAFGHWAEARRKERKREAAAEEARRTAERSRAEAREAGEASEPTNEPSRQSPPPEPSAVLRGKSEGCGPGAPLRFPQKTNQKRRLSGRAHLRNLGAAA
jgi:hypothetical protein